MERLLYVVARALVGFLQALPLTWVARLGRAGGTLAYGLDRRHRRVALKNLTACLGGEKPASEIRALALENFRRVGENFACAAKTAAMSPEQLRGHVEFAGSEKILAPPGQPFRNALVAVGHFGNFELYARFGQFVPGYQCATTFRALPQPSLNRLMQDLRGSSGCLYFERLTEARALKAAMQRDNLLLGFLADQHAARSGYRLPFLGRDCSTSTAPAVYAHRYGCPLFTAICYRMGLGRWRIEVGDAIPTHEDGRPRDPLDIMRDVNRAFETAVRRDPANWFWVHNRWKTTGREPRSANREPAGSEAVEDGG
jgi:lauroyl/myristoyl acyltransferase